MPVRLIESMSTTEPLADLFSDVSILRAMLDFEVVLARVEARIGIIPAQSAEAIAKAADPTAFDVAELSRSSLRAGTPAIPLVKALIERVRSKDASAAGFVHFGATSQDVTDTAMILLLKRAQPLIEADLARAEKALHALSKKHASTVMLGRTLLQAAPPITLGLKLAGWLGAIRRGREQLTSAFHQALILQFGGAVGTLSVLGPHGTAVAEALAAELGLACPDAPWHTHRDRLATLVCTCGVVTGSLGKIARDISLLMQNEVAEASEPSSAGRGGSSTMPHKRNPIGSAITLAAATRMPGLVSTYLASMLQEHERAVGGIQSEWPTLAAVMQTTGMAAASIAEIAEGVTFDAARMKKNLDATQGLIYAEKAMILLAAKVGRDRAHELLEQAVQQAHAHGRPLADVLAENAEVREHIDAVSLRQLAIAEEYLGAAELFRTRLLAGGTATENTPAKKD